MCVKLTVFFIEQTKNVPFLHPFFSKPHRVRFHGQARRWAGKPYTKLLYTVLDKDKILVKINASVQIQNPIAHVLIEVKLSKRTQLLI